jgi:hypothetical protein
MDAGFGFSKVPTPDAMQGHDKMYSLCYYSSFCIDPKHVIRPYYSLTPKLSE